MTSFIGGGGGGKLGNIMVTLAIALNDHIHTDASKYVLRGEHKITLWSQ